MRFAYSERDFAISGGQVWMIANSESRYSISASSCANNEIGYSKGTSNKLVGSNSETRFTHSERISL